MANIYAVLVGINAYQSTPLNGCLNDVEALSECLTKLYGGLPGSVLKIKKVTDLEDGGPTRNNIISAFDFFEQAEQGDECLFYYSGHGSYSDAPIVFQSASGLVQSLVCIDSREPGGKDLMDRELGFLIWRTLQKRPGVNFVAITDCCHSGTVTKSFLTRKDVTERMMRSEPGHAPEDVEGYLGFDEKVGGLSAYPLSERDGKAYIRSVQGDHIHLAASRDYQTAKELPIGGKVRGAFTFSLIEQLYRTGGSISYRDLVERIGIQINNVVDDQLPGLNTNGKLTGIDGDRIFLGKSLIGGAAYKVYYDRIEMGWCIDAGPIHNLNPGDQVVTSKGIICEVLHSASAGVSRLNNDIRLGGIDEVWSAEVIRKKPSKFTVGVPSGLGLPSASDFNAAASTQTCLSFEDDKTGRFVIGKNDLNEIYLSLGGGSVPLFLPVFDLSPLNLGSFLDSAERVARSFYLRELEGTGNQKGNLPYTVNVFRSIDNISMAATGFEKIGNGNSVQEVYYKKKGKDWHQPVIKVSVTNNSEERLWVGSAYLGFDHAITGNLFSPVEIAKGKTEWLTFLGQPGSDLIYLGIDQHIRELNYTEVTEYIKLFVAVEQISTDGLTQPGVKLTEAPGQKNLKAIVNGRGAASRPFNEPSGLYWYTETLGFTISQPLDGVAIGDGEKQLGILKIRGHTGFRADASLNSSQLTSRNADGIQGPSLLNSAFGMEPLDITGSQRSTSLMDVIELYNISGLEYVDRDNPLVFSIDKQRDMEVSNILPVGFDSETGLYFPLGYMDNNGDIVIEILPKPTASDHAVTQRSFWGSIKLYFQKVIGQKLGFRGETTRLAKVCVDSALNVHYMDDHIEIENLVKDSSAIILFIHGIIGDTEGMVKCIKMPGEGMQTLEQRSDLVLAFDYENLNTPIQQTANLLLDRLKSVGLGVGHGKKLTVIAHSMGGLVSRSMIERNPGVVSSLIMLGTPNNGTPWADVRDLAAALITYAINGASLLKPWMFLLSGIGKLVEGAQVTLKEMDAKDGIYGNLNKGKDPEIPYVVIAGNTRDIISAYGQASQLIERCLSASIRNSVYAGLDRLLFHLPNDIAVSDESIITFKEEPEWLIKPVVYVVPSDHMNYFNNREVLSILTTLI
ncbi:caspase family protein [Pedobacter miscanthi]|uniref:caspase family protein n=1 Tax=Pedobacter miscanthi TaxID=2259170 RepID=UPI00292D0F12|nr:caspase family protein [Pedobacter miscanthi]